MAIVTERKKEIIKEASKLAEEITKDIPINEFNEFTGLIQNMQIYLKIYGEIDSFGTTTKWRNKIDFIKDEINKFSDNTEKHDFIGYLWREVKYQKAIREVKEGK